MPRFGCCPDEKTPKKGPKGKGCPKIKCEDTRYGCCPGEDKEIATGHRYEGCKEINKKNCTANFFGCKLTIDLPAKVSYSCFRINNYAIFLQVVWTERLRVGLKTSNFSKFLKNLS